MTTKRERNAEMKRQLIPPDVRALIRKGEMSCDETCGPWCRPIHYLIQESSILHRNDRNETIPYPSDSLDGVRLRAHGILHQLIREGKKAPFTGCSRNGFAASLLYIAAILENVRISQSEIAISLGISTEQTIRSRYHAIQAALGLAL